MTIIDDNDATPLVQRTENTEQSSAKNAFKRLLTSALPLAPIGYYFAWLFTKTAGPEMLTVGDEDNCYGSGGKIYPTDPGATISCTDLAGLNQTTTPNWPEFGVYGCYDGTNYVRSTSSLIEHPCQALKLKCASYFMAAFFSGSEDHPYSKHGKFQNAYGSFCKEYVSSGHAAAFIILALIALPLVIVASVNAYRLFNPVTGHAATSTTSSASNNRGETPVLGVVVR